VTDIGDILQKHTGRKVNVKIVPEEEAIEYHKAHNSLPPELHWLLYSWATWFKAMENGEANTVDPTMEKLLGRKQKGIEEMAQDIFQMNKPMETTEFDNYTK
jgi:hypothetical protein